MSNDHASDISAAGRRDLTHHLHPYTQLRQLEQEGPLVIVRATASASSTSAAPSTSRAWPGCGAHRSASPEKRLAEAAYRQMQVLPYYHAFSGKVPGPVTDLVEALMRWAPVPMGRVLLANSGSESNDTALKLVRYYWNARAGRRRRRSSPATGPTTA
jgi:4-aminobutyrate--pyruvate transaminase